VRRAIVGPRLLMRSRAVVAAVRPGIMTIVEDGKLVKLYAFRNFHETSHHLIVAHQHRAHAGFA